MIQYDKRSLIITGVLSLIAAYFANRFCEAVQSVPATGLLPSMEDVGIALLSALLAVPLRLRTTDVGLLALGLGFAAVWLVYLYRMANNQYRRPGEEHGSSRWGTRKDIQPFENPEPDRNIILSQTERLNIDEFANMGVIPDADKKLSVMRSRNMSASIVLQFISQLEKNYKDTKETLIDNCDSLLFLGSKSNKTNKEIAEQIGKATVHSTAVTESKGSSGSYSEADQIIGRYLIDPAEIGRLERDECLVLITGLPPFRSKKYDVTKHPRWHFISS